MIDGFVCTSHLVFQSHPSQVAAEKAEKDRAEAAKVKEERGDECCFGTTWTTRFRAPEMLSPLLSCCTRPT